MKRIVLLLATLTVLAGCTEPFTIFHSQTGQPVIIGRRSYTYEGCFTAMREEAERLGVTFRYIHIHGSWHGRSLLWPFQPGYACEAAVGPERLPNGIYENVPPLVPHG